MRSAVIRKVIDVKNNTTAQTPPVSLDPYVITVQHSLMTIHFSLTHRSRSATYA